MIKNVLVAGGTGLIGRHLIPLLLQQNIKVHVLSTRTNAQVDGAKTFLWQPNNFIMDEEALGGVDTIINLAGASINKRWTTEYKQEIYDSRTKTAHTLYKALEWMPEHAVKTYISSSGVSIYPSSLTEKYTEEAKPGNDFLAQVVLGWEAGADAFERLNLRVVKMRTGIVLSADGGFLSTLEPIVKTGLAAPLGSGKQYISWIHIKDLCGMFHFALKNESVAGAINAVAPQPETNKDFTQTLANVLHRPAFLPNVPKVALKLTMGQMGQLALNSQFAKADKIKELGFLFEYPKLPDALHDIYS